MEYVDLTPETITAITREFVGVIKGEGLVLVLEKDAELIFKLKRERSRLMTRKWVTTQQIENCGLIEGVKTRQTVVNMIKDGRLRENVDFFIDAQGKYKILTSAIKRLNDE